MDMRVIQEGESHVRRLNFVALHIHKCSPANPTRMSYVRFWILSFGCLPFVDFDIEIKTKLEIVFVSRLHHD